MWIPRDDPILDVRSAVRWRELPPLSLEIERPSRFVPFREPLDLAESSSSDVQMDVVEVIGEVRRRELRRRAPRPTGRHLRNLQQRDESTRLVVVCLPVAVLLLLGLWIALL